MDVLHREVIVWSVIVVVAIPFLLLIAGNVKRNVENFQEEVPFREVEVPGFRESQDNFREAVNQLREIGEHFGTSTLSSTSSLEDFPFATNSTTTF